MVASKSFCSKINSVDESDAEWANDLLLSGVVVVFQYIRAIPAGFDERIHLVFLRSVLQSAEFIRDCVNIY